MVCPPPSRTASFDLLMYLNCPSLRFISTTHFLVHPSLRIIPCFDHIIYCRYIDGVLLHTIKRWYSPSSGWRGLVSLSPWDGTVPFPVYVVEDMKSFSPNIFHPPPEEIDICSYITANRYPTERLYFFPSTYSPPLVDEHMSSKEGGFFPGLD